MLPPQPDLAEDFPPVPYENWRQLVEEDLNGAPFERRLVTHTYEGVQIQPVYSAHHWPSAGDPSGLPGLPPYTRGGQPLGGARHGWLIEQEHTYPCPQKANAAILDDLAHGVNSLILRFDRAARTGLDPGDDRAADLVGRDGIMIYNVDDLDLVLKDVRPELINISLEAGTGFRLAAALLVALWQRRGVSFAEARGAFNADPLATLVRAGWLPVPLDEAILRMVDLARWTDENLPNVTSVRVRTGTYHNAGATVVQDLAFSMATGIEYLRALTAGGMSVGAAARQILFSYNVGCHFFLASAKLRAARKLWARVVEACGGDADAQTMRMSVRTSRRVMTRRDPWVNMLRNTVCCFAGAIAGADAVNSQPFDAALGLPDRFSRRIARNTQIILQEEAHLHRAIDPAGGSWFLENLTDELAVKAWELLQVIEVLGGMKQAVLSGWIARHIDEAFTPRRKNLAKRKDPITGVSEFPNLAEQPLAREQLDYVALRDAAVQRHGTRPTTDAGQRLHQLIADRGASGDAVMPALIDAAKAGTTIGEIYSALTQDAETVHITPLSAHRFAEAFEALRDASDAYLAKTGARPKVFLANMGPIAHHTARATYARNFFQAGGFDVITNDGFAHADTAAEACRESGAHIAVICSSDTLYETVVAQVAPALKAAGARTVVLAGQPGNKEAAYQEAGVDRFIYIRCDVLQTLQELLREEGVLS
ncbi:MAG: methylmalonyl-CoA mutase family protein [Phycisphaerae bacterium]|jgi:methylmalonyl-CoA mutase